MLRVGSTGLFCELGEHRSDSGAEVIDVVVDEPARDVRLRPFAVLLEGGDRLVVFRAIWLLTGC
jgi:hypothetical protein